MTDPGGSLGSELNGWVTELKNLDPSYTTCCIQMSHAINMSFHIIDVTKMVGTQEYRRKTRGFKIRCGRHKEFHYLASVDEMKEFLNTTFGGGEEIFAPRRWQAGVSNRGEIVRSGPARDRRLHEQPVRGFHTEVWTGDDWHQGWMKGRMDPFGWGPVWFWDMGAARNDKLPMV